MICLLYALTSVGQMMHRYTQKITDDLAKFVSQNEHMLGCFNDTLPFEAAVPVGISTGSPAGPCASSPPRPSRGATGLKPRPAAREGRGAARVPTRRTQTPGSAACHCRLPCLRSEKVNASEVRKCLTELKGAWDPHLTLSTRRMTFLLSMRAL